VLLGQAHFGVVSEQDAATAHALEESARKHIGTLRNTFATSVDAARAGEGWEVRAEVVGATVPAPAEIAEIERKLASEVAAPVTLSAWARTEVVVSGAGYQSVQERIESAIRRQLEASRGTKEAQTPAGAETGIP
jgi:hypothetical protein